MGLENISNLVCVTQQMVEGRYLRKLVYHVTISSLKNNNFTFIYIWCADGKELDKFGEILPAVLDFIFHDNSHSALGIIQLWYLLL